MSGGGGVTERIVPLLEQGRWAEAEEALSEVGKSGLAPEEREILFRLWGISAYRRGDRGEARRRFAEGHEAFPSSGDIAFSYAQEQLHTGDIDEAFALFARYPFPAVSAAHAMALARYAYLCNRQADGIAALKPVLEQVERLGIADPTFLVIRGLPMFETLWAALGALYAESGVLDEFRSLTDRAAQRLVGEEFAIQFALLDGLQHSDWESYLGLLRSLAADRRKEGQSTGHAEMKAAILESRHCNNWLAASERLNSVALNISDEQTGRAISPQYDHPWLEDVRTLALAEAAARFGEKSLEADLVATFLAHQPMLLEPEHAFAFHLMAYQAGLKDRARKG